MSEHQSDAFVLAIRNLEVLSNEDPSRNPKDVGSMAAALQCQIWMQFDNHSSFCKALHAFCGRAMQKARYIMICVFYAVPFLVGCLLETGCISIMSWVGFNHEEPLCLSTTTFGTEISQQEPRSAELRGFSHRNLKLCPGLCCPFLCDHDLLNLSPMQAGSNFRAMYVVDWDKENYFSVLNVRRRKFEKERLERQLQAEAEKKKKEEIEARQAEFARAEVERLKTEQMAAVLRYVMCDLFCEIASILIFLRRYCK